MGEGKRRQTKPRLTGLGASAAGVGASAQWENVETDAKVAQDVVTFLEDRRILFLPVNVEVVECSMGSVRELREFLTEALQRTSPNSPLARCLQLMRGACRDLTTRIDSMGRRESGGYAEWGWSRFDHPDGVMALGIWRGLVLGNVAEIVERYSLVVDGPLAGALPTGE
jgi:hypothetical protein